MAELASEGGRGFACLLLEVQFHFEREVGRAYVDLDFSTGPR